MRPLQEAEKATITRELLLDQAKPEAFSAYFKLYESIFCPQDRQSTIIVIDDAVFTSHADIIECARRLRQNPELTREELEGTLSPNDTVSPRDRKNAIQSVVRALFMLDCSLKDKYSGSFEVNGYVPVRWEGDETFDSYVERAIPKCQIQEGRWFEAHKHKKLLRAWKLKKRYRLRFRPTDNIMEHLLYDPRTKVVQVFHHTAYLKAHLKRSKYQPLAQRASESLKFGTLPPQLLLETLHTIHYILFPVSNDASGKSNKILQSLIRKHNFDPNAEWDDGYIREDFPVNFKYQYWNYRLQQLYDIVINPPPSNRLISWIERHTSERNALTVAIIGLFLSALFGLLTCIIGVAQLVIAILAWKRPREPS